MATINASKTGSIIMLFVAMVYLWGFSAIWYFVGVILGFLVFIPFAFKLKDNSGGRFYTMADYFKYNYGNKIAKAVSGMVIFLMFGLLVVSLIAASKIFVFFVGWPFWLCTLIVSLVIFIYVQLGGFQAVVKTDKIQYVAMLSILGLLALVMFNSSEIPLSDWNIFQADVGTMVGFFLLGILYPFSMPDLWQRIYSAENKAKLKGGLLLSSGIFFVFAVLLGLVALTIKVKFPEVDPDLALLHAFKNLLSPGVLGLSIILLLSAIMSSSDTYLFTGASAIVQDHASFDKENVVTNIKKVIIVLIALAAIIAISIQSLVVSGYIFVSGAIILSVISVATWFRKKIKQETMIFGFVFGVISVGLFLISSLQKGEIQPIIIMVGLVTTLGGLFIGGLFSYFRKQIGR